MAEKINIFDTTLRDGEQSPGCSMNFEEKLRMARQLEALGVDVIEAGFPIASDGDFEAVKEIAIEINSCKIAGLCRAKNIDIERAWEALKYSKNPCIHTFIATSDVHMQYKLRMNREQVLDEAVKAVTLAKSFCEDVEFSAEDASRTDIDFLCQVFQAVIEAGATVLNYPDTVGYAIPSELGKNIAYIMKNVKDINNVVLSVHCHNDLGLAVANSLAAVENGARQIECTVNGIGERAGNASLEEVVMSMKVRKDLYSDFYCDVDSTQIYKSSKLLSSITGMFIQRNKAIVGENAFAHEAGIHQDGVLKQSQTYEIMTPQSVGISKSMLVLGKHSGRHALTKRFEELGYTLTKDELNDAYKKFTEIADKKKEVYDEDLLAIIHDEVSKIPERFSFQKLQVFSGTSVVPTATVTLVNTENEEVMIDSSTGDGPVDAACRAIERITNVEGWLLDYSIKSSTVGKDAVGEVFVRVKIKESEFVGRSASTDVVEASSRAYLDAINRALYAEKCKRERPMMKEKESTP